VKKLVADGQVSAGHARALLAVRDPAVVAKRVVDNGLTVRDVERIAQQEAASPPSAEGKQKTRPPRDADTRNLEKALEEVLGLTVRIKHSGEGGEVAIRYRSLEQLDSLCRRLRG
jgi:ParB family chromosome partitioning protein